MNRRNKIILQLFMNSIPLLGVIYFEWSVFALIYTYWLETLSNIFFSSIIILTAQNHIQKSFHAKKAIKYFMFNAGILFFYLLFIIVFIGFMVSAKQEGVRFVNYLVFIDPIYRYTILGLFMIKLLELLTSYFFSGAYQNTNPDEFYKFFDIRFIMIHFVIILGFFAFKFVSEKLNSDFGIIAFAAIFVFIKSIVDIVLIFFKKDSKQDITDLSEIN